MSAQTLKYLFFLSFFPIAAQEAASSSGTVTVPYLMMRDLENQLAESKKADATLSHGMGAILRSAHYHLNLTGGKPKITASFTVRHIAHGSQKCKLLRNDAQILDLQPEDSLIVPVDDYMQLMSSKEGNHLCDITLNPQQKQITSAPCAVATFRVSGINQDHAVSLKINDQNHLLTTDQSIALPAAGAAMSWNLIDGKEAATAAKPLAPSKWEWNQEIAVQARDGMLYHLALMQAHTNGGDTMSATLALPAEAVDIEASSENLLHQEVTRDIDFTQKLQLRWRHSPRLTRSVVLHYRSIASDATETWQLLAPRGVDGKPTGNTFYLAEDPHRNFTSDFLAGPYLSNKLNAALQKNLTNAPHYRIVTDQSSIAIRQKTLPTVAMDDAIMSDVQCLTRVETDGAILTEASYQVSYTQAARVPLLLPKDATLLSCTVGGEKKSPLIVSPEQWEIVLPPLEQAGAKLVKISYTQKIKKLESLQGQVTLQLPRTRYFIAALKWQINLPAGYSAEVAGNMNRSSNNGLANAIIVGKNTCRDEQPEAILFYQFTPVSAN